MAVLLCRFVLQGVFADHAVFDDDPEVGRGIFHESEVFQRVALHEQPIYIFNPEDLDNADIISMVESSPTYLRDKRRIENEKRTSKLPYTPYTLYGCF